MLLYRAYSLIIGSELDLPELPEAAGEPDVLIRLGSIPHTTNKTTVTDELLFPRIAGGFHVRNGREIIVDPLPGADIDALRILLLGRIMAYLLRQRGWLPLHASGAIINGCGALFLGPSGSGKSTAAAAFHARGHQVIMDDVAAVRISRERCIALPGRASLRLHENTRALSGDGATAVFQRDKYLVDVSRGTFPDRAEVKRIYAIADGDEIGTQPIAPLSAVRLLSENSFFRRGEADTESLRMQLANCAAVAGATIIRRLTRPRRLSALPDLARFVEKDLAADE